MLNNKCDALAIGKGATKKGPKRKRTVAAPKPTTPPNREEGITTPPQKRTAKTVITFPIRRFAIGTKIKSNGTRWKLPENQFFYDEIVANRKYRKSFRYDIKWADGVIERVLHKHVFTMIDEN